MIGWMLDNPKTFFSKNRYDAMTYELLYYAMSKIRGQFVLIKWNQENLSTFIACFFSWYNYSTWDDYHLAFSTSWTSCKIFVVVMLTCYQIHELSNIMLWICELVPVSKKFNGEFYKSISASRWNGCFDRAKLGLCRSGDIFSACFPHRYRFVYIFIWLIITLNCKSIRGKREVLKRNLEITHYI